MFQVIKVNFVWPRPPGGASGAAAPLFEHIEHTLMIDTPRYKELQETLAQQTDEKGRIDTLVDMGVEIRSIDVEHALKMARHHIALQNGSLRAGHRPRAEPERILPVAAGPL